MPLPQELLNAILEQLCDDDDALNSCPLAASALREPATPLWYSTGLALMRDSPHLTTYIRRITNPPPHPETTTAKHCRSSMHPSLKIRYLDALPLTMRRVAIAACADSRTYDELERLLGVVDGQSLEERVRFLPVFYTNLDPANIPRAAQLDGMTEAVEDYILCAVESLERLLMLSVPPAAGPDLWPRIWAWCNFLYTYWDALEGLTTEETMFYITFLRGVGRLHDHGPTRKLITSTPGFRVLVAKSWSLFPAIDEKNPLYMTAVLQELSGFFVDVEVGNPAFFDEFVEGAGGHISDFAALVISYFHRLLDPESMLYSKVADYVNRLLSFICDADSFSRAEKETLNVPPGRFCRCLLDHGLVGALVAALRTLATVCKPDNDDVYVLRDCLKFLRRIIQTSPGYLYLRQAIDAGLVHAAMQCATRESTEGFSSNLKQLLCWTIPDALVNYHVVLGIKAALPEIEALVAKAPPAFRKSIFDVGWQQLQEVVTQRAAVLTDEFRLESSKACDNRECNAISAKADFHRCSGCKSLYYCSSACQTADWKRRHRKACRFYRTLELSEHAEPDLDPRERAYLRKLIHHDWNRGHIGVCARQIKFIADNPSTALFLTLFDYSKCDVEIEVHAVPKSQVARALKAQAPQEWADIVARALNSDGRMQLHVMRVHSGVEATRYWVVPFRSNSAAIHDTLRSMAPSMPEDRGVILELMAQADRIFLHPDFNDILEIH
ncbi:hypothetical protein C8R46DRAFT_1361666 [Mycena filopes]|nr:hypothetical protein C8R46DRAFT_1361666 [Mycena filopes]